MSKHWGYVCRTHDPVIVSDAWFNHGDDLLARVYQLEKRGDWPDDPEYGPHGRWNALGPEPLAVVKGPVVTKAPVEWLRQHPRCDVALRSEYGDVCEIEL